MFCYRLRTLLIVLALGPPVLAGAIRFWQHWPIRDIPANFGRAQVVSSGATVYIIEFQKDGSRRTTSRPAGIPFRINSP